jgi:hypothetical protein
MSTFLIGFLTVGVCVHVLGGYVALVAHYFGR